MTDRDPSAEALTYLETPPLDPRFAARVGACARAELASASAPLTTSRGRPALGMGRLRVVLGAGLVPALLSLMAVVETAATVTKVAKIYGKAPNAASE